MKKILAILILAGALAPLHAQDNDALWKSTLAQLDASRKWAAGEIETISDVGKDGALKHEVSSMRLRGWEKGKPAYALVRQEPPDEKKSAADLSFLDKFNALSEEATANTPTRTDGQSLDGVPCTVFESRADQALQKATMKLWVDPASGAPRQMVVTVHAPLVMDATIITRYTTGAQGQPLAGVIDYAFEILMPFRHSKARIKQTNSGWVARPAN